MSTPQQPEQSEQWDKPERRSTRLSVLFGCLFSGLLIPFAIIFALFATCMGFGFLSQVAGW